MKQLRSLLRIVGSLWFAAVLLVLLLLGMACATVFESAHGTEQALALFYYSWWFETLLGLLFINVAAAVICRYPFDRKHIGFAVTHVAVLVILVGALISKHFGVQGMLGLAEGQTLTHMRDAAQPVLTVSDLRGDARATRDLNPVLFAGFRELTDPPAEPLRLGDVQITVRKYLPDSDWKQNVVELDDPQFGPAVQLSLAGAGDDGLVWAFPDHPAALGGTMAGFRWLPDAASLARLVHESASSQPAGMGTVHVTCGETSFDLPLAGCLRREVPLGDTGYTLHVLRYMPHATVGADRELRNASNEPVNPAIEVEVIGPTQREQRFCFARFPGFRHNADLIPDVQVTFDHPSVSVAATPIEILAAPGTPVYARFSADGQALGVRELPVGTPVETPWADRALCLVRFVPHARMDWQLVPVTPIRQDRMPAVELVVEGGEQPVSVWVQRYQPERIVAGGTPVELGFDDRTVPLGFSVTLDRFRLGTYPGSNRPRSYESQIRILDSVTGREQNLVVSMNSPVAHGGYELYQSSFAPQGSGFVSYLSVARDPGRPVVYAGYISVMIGMVLVLATRLAGRRRPAAASRAAARATGLAALWMVLSATAWPATAASPPASLDYDCVRGLVVQWDGRWPPLDTCARDIVESVTGTVSFEDYDPVGLLLAWSLDPETWEGEPLITIANRELRQELQLPLDRTMFSYNELSVHNHLHVLAQEIRETGGGRKLDPLEAKVNDIFDKLLTLRRVFDGQALHFVPDPSSVNAAWKTINEAQPADPPAPNSAAAAWTTLRAAFGTDDAPAFAAAAVQLAQRLAALPAAQRPTPERIALELRYNRLQPFRVASYGAAGGVVLAVIALLIGIWKQSVAHQIAVTLRAVALLAMVVGFGVLTYGLWLRWQIAGRIPAANMFESLLFLSWGAGAIGIISRFLLRDRFVPLTASAMGALALILADRLPLDHFVRPIVPVLLDTVWMSIHVPIIMASYAVLAIAVLIAHAQLFVMAVAPARRGWATAIDELHYWYAFVGSLLLLAGIITGSMWASSSWGRYWGWDPKEVWSLVAFLGYMAILHVRIDHERTPGWAYALGGILSAVVLVIIVLLLAPLTPTKVVALTAATIAAIIFVLGRGHLATALKSVLAFWLIIMTYVGVNYVLGTGLHSYGFGTGAVVRYLFLVGGIDLLLMIACSTLHLVQRSGNGAQPAKA